MNDRIWVYTGTGTVLGLGLLWWATEQLGEIQRTVGSTFEYPEGRVLLWLFTLIATGFAFGLAAAAVRQVAVRGRVAIMSWSVLPLLIIAWFYSRLAFGWPAITVPAELFEFLTSQTTIVASALTLGFFLSAVLGLPIRPRIDESEPGSDQKSDSGAVIT